MEKYTSLIKTRTFWASVVGIVVQVLALFKIDLGIDANGMVDVIMQLVTMASFALAIVFRAKATAQVVTIAATPTPVDIAKVKIESTKTTP